MKKNLIIVVVVAVIVGGAAFWGGMTYGKSQALTPQALQNLSQTQRRQLFAAGGAGGNFAGTGQAGQRGGQNGGGFTAGNIIAVSGQTMTVKLNDGSSKIVLFSGSTNINKTDTGVAADLVVGKSVTVSGTANSDGSITATSISLRTLPPAQTSGSPAPSSAN